MNLNCNGVKGPSKQAAFHATLDIHKPDIVLGCEANYVIGCTLMTSSLTITLCFVKRAMQMTGVFVATTDKIISYEIPHPG